MNDMPKILLGLAVFVALAAFPVIYNLATPEAGAAPDLQYPAQDVATECVLPEGEMRTGHMDLLMQWREEVVREQDRQYTDHQGLVHDKSLSNTCLSCHDNKEAFCDRCHTYMDVDPYCWDCHIALQPNTGEGVQ